MASSSNRSTNDRVSAGGNDEDVGGKSDDNTDTATEGEIDYDEYVKVPKVCLQKTNNVWDLQCDGKTVELPDELRACPNLALNTEESEYVLTTGTEMDEDSIYSLKFEDECVHVVKEALGEIDVVDSNLPAEPVTRVASTSQADSHLAHSTSSIVADQPNVTDVPGRVVPGVPKRNVPGRDVPDVPGREVPGVPKRNVPGRDVTDVPGRDVTDVPGREVPGVPEVDALVVPQRNLTDVPKGDVTDVPVGDVADVSKINVTDVAGRDVSDTLHTDMADPASSLNAVDVDYEDTKANLQANSTAPETSTYHSTRNVKIEQDQEMEATPHTGITSPTACQKAADDGNDDSATPKTSIDHSIENVTQDHEMKATPHTEMTSPTAFLKAADGENEHTTANFRPNSTAPQSSIDHSAGNAEVKHDQEREVDPNSDLTSLSARQKTLGEENEGYTNPKTSMDRSTRNIGKEQIIKADPPPNKTSPIACHKTIDDDNEDIYGNAQSILYDKGQATLEYPSDGKKPVPTPRRFHNQGNRQITSTPDAHEHDAKGLEKENVRPPVEHHPIVPFSDGEPEIGSNMKEKSHIDTGNVDTVEEGVIEGDMDMMRETQKKSSPRRPSRRGKGMSLPKEKPTYGVLEKASVSKRVADADSKGSDMGLNEKRLQSNQAMASGSKPETLSNQPIVPGAEVFTGNRTEQEKMFELKISMKYHKGKGFEYNASIPCEHDQYMRWCYVLGNSQLFRRKLGVLKGRNIPDIVIEEIEGEKWMTIDIGKVTNNFEEGQAARLRERIIREILLETENLVVNSFHTTGADRHKIAELMMENSIQEMENELWLYADKQSDLIHYVYPKQRANNVDTLIKRSACKTRISCKDFKVALVFSKVFDHYKVRQEFKKKYEDRVTLALDSMESTNKCIVTLQGTMADVESAEQWICGSYIDNFTVNDISFNDIKKLENPLNFERVVEECLQQTKDAFWFVNETCKKISVCSDTAGTTDKLSSDLKKCLKTTEVPLDLKERLLDMAEIRDCTAALRYEERTICVVGTKKAIQRVNKLKEELNKKEAESQYPNRDHLGEPQRAVQTNAEDTTKSLVQGEKPQQKDEMLQQKMLFKVLKSNDLKMLCDSLEAKEFAKQHNVTLRQAETGFILQGSPSNCAKVKGMLINIIDENKRQRQLEEKHKTFDLPNGHRVTLQTSANTPENIDLVVEVDNVEPEMAKFRRPNKLHLPKWIDGSKQERKTTGNSVEEMLTFCWENNHLGIKIEIIELQDKIMKQFMFAIFEVLVKQSKGSIPLELYISTNPGKFGELCVQGQACYERHCSASLLPSSNVEFDSGNDVMEAKSAQGNQSIDHSGTKAFLEVTVIIGQLNGTKADVIVNTTARDLRLDIGKVSASLLQSAGPGLQKEVNQKRPNGIQFGDIVTTLGYNLQGCRHVLHGALCSYSGPQNLKGLQKFVFDCLMETETLKCQTIAFPAIGTGNLGYPKAEVAKAMFRAVKAFEGRRHFVKEVRFVIYDGDQEAVKEFQKEEELYAKYCKSYSQDLKTIGQVGVIIKQGTLADIATEGILYIWGRQASYNVRVRDHELLKVAGQSVQNLWTKHRDNQNNRSEPLRTHGGDLDVSHIIHVFSEDSTQSVQEALLAGFRRADDLASVTVYFSDKSPFLKYGQQLIDAFVQSILDIKKNKSSLRTILLVIESKNKNLVPQFKVYLEHCMNSKTSNGRLGNPTSEYNAARGFQLQEPESQSIHGRGGGTDVDSQILDWNKNRYLPDSRDILDCYVWIEKIPADFTCDVLNDVIKSTFPKLDIYPVFIPGRTEAILICTSKEDADFAIRRNQTGPSSGVCFKQMPDQRMDNFEVEVDALKDQGEDLGNRGISIKKDKGKFTITAPTLYQLDYALFKLNLADGDRNGRNRGDSEGFEIVEECTQEVWDVVEIIKADRIKDMKEEGMQITYANGSFNISGLKVDTDHSYIDVIRSFIITLNAKEFVEVAMNETDVEKVKQFCREIEGERNSQCCVYVEKRKAVLAFSDTYDGVYAVKHQLLVKDGQVKVTGRRGRAFKGFEEERSEVITRTINTPDDSSRDDGTNQARNVPVRERGEKKKNPEFDLKRQAKNLQEYPTAENLKVYVYEANILKLPVDCIVNAANSSLQHGGGVARVIAQAAGRQLDQDGFTHIRNHGEVPVGKMCVTTAGRLHYDCVIHAVGPCWSDYYPHSLQEVQQCERDLYSALMESFEAAESRGLESIALPAISAAIFAVPEELCVYHYAKATLDYSKKSTNSPKPLKEIHFIDINPRIIRSIQKMFKAMLKQGDSLDYCTEKFVKTRTSPSRGPDTWQKQENTKETKSDKFKPVYYKESGTHIFESEKSKLFIQSGDLMKVKADAIVSIEDLDGSGKGKIAELILKNVPLRNMDNYLRSKKSLFRTSSTKRGDVYASWGNDCGYRDVLHAVLPYEIRNESPEDRKAVISLAVKNVLKTMKERSLYSVVMCLMGAGKETKEDVRIAADAFIHAYQEYCLSWQYRKIQIKLVCRLQSDMNNVMEKFGEYGWTGIPPPLPPIPTHSTGVGNMDSEEPVSLENCVICMDKITDRKVLQCGHAFDRDCIDQAFKVQKKCPTCGEVCGILIGDQPADGHYDVRNESWNHCAGYEHYGRIAIKYTFLDGTQGPDHPNPGKRYKGITRTGYLPDIADGREVLEMLKIAFNRKLTFTIGSSRTSGEEGVITWNDIHHKTDPKPNTQFGYPDPTYLDRVRDELSAKGVTTKDIIQKKY